MVSPPSDSTGMFSVDFFGEIIYGDFSIKGSTGYDVCFFFVMTFCFFLVYSATTNLIQISQIK